MTKGNATVRCTWDKTSPRVSARGLNVTVPKILPRERRNCIFSQFCYRISNTTPVFEKRTNLSIGTAVMERNTYSLSCRISQQKYASKKSWRKVFPLHEGWVLAQKEPCDFCSALVSLLRCFCVGKCRRQSQSKDNRPDNSALDWTGQVASYYRAFAQIGLRRFYMDNRATLNGGTPQL